jgi:hypothetical protein
MRVLGVLAYLALPGMILLSDGFLSPLTDKSMPLSCEADFHQRARRFNHSVGARAEGNAIGLGGGVEIVVTKKFCKAILPHLVSSASLMDDSPESLAGCSEVLPVVKRAGRLWSDHHPTLYFTARLATGTKPSEDPAEIYLTGETMPKDQDGTLAYCEQKVPYDNGRAGTAARGTNGRSFPRGKPRHYRIAFSTAHCFRLDLTLFDEDDARLERRGHGTCTVSRFSFETILAHEIGHALGMGHIGKEATRREETDFSYFLATKGTHAIDLSVSKYTHVNHEDVCNSLTVRRSKSDCDARVRRSKQKACEKDALFCSWQHKAQRCAYRETLSSALMSSTLARNEMVIRPSEADLALLFFLYPHKSRHPGWQRNPVPLMTMTMEKLRHLLSESEGGPPPVEASKRQLADLVAKHRSWHAVKRLDEIVDEAGKDDASSGVLGRLHVAASRVFESLGFGSGSDAEGKDDWDEDGIPDALEEEFREALQMANDDSSDGDDDPLRVGGDGGGDHDGDGIPDDVELGLAALAEVLREPGARNRRPDADDERGLHEEL